MTTQTLTHQRIANAARAAGRRSIKVLGRLRARLILATIVAVAALGVGTGLAFARSSPSAIGTGVVVVDTAGRITLVNQNRTSAEKVPPTFKCEINSGIQ